MFVDDGTEVILVDLWLIVKRLYMFVFTQSDNKNTSGSMVENFSLKPKFAGWRSILCMFTSFNVIRESLYLLLYTLIEIHFPSQVRFYLCKPDWHDK